MQLFNADGSRSEISGNGVRCLAAWIASTQNLEAGTFVDIETDAGIKELELLERRDGRYTFCAAMGHPEHIRQHEFDLIDLYGERVMVEFTAHIRPTLKFESVDELLEAMGKDVARCHELLTKIVPA